jgi:hypothetical protein
MEWSIQETSAEAEEAGRSPSRPLRTRAATAAAFLTKELRC